MFYGWAVVVAASGIRVIMYGLAFTSGVVYVVILENFGTGKAETSWISSLITSVTYLVTPLAGVLVNRFGWRLVALSGGILCCVGLFLSVFANNLALLCLFYGIITGVGSGTAFMAGGVAAPIYFQRRKNQNLAVGIASCGGGLGSFIFPPLVRFLEYTYGWRGMFMILAGISLHFCVFGMLLRPLPKDTENKNSKISKRRTSAHVPVKNDWRFLRNWKFQVLAMNNFLFAFGASIVYGHLAAYAQDHLDIHKTEAAILYSIIGVSLMIGKIAQGMIADYHKMYPICAAINQVIAFYFTGGVATLFLFIDGGFPGLVVYSTVFGCCYAANGGSLTPAILLQLFGENQLSLPYGVVMATMACGHIIGAPVAGWMYEAILSYYEPFVVAALTMIVSALILLFPRHYMKTTREQVEIVIPEPGNTVDYNTDDKDIQKTETEGLMSNGVEMKQILKTDEESPSSIDKDQSQSLILKD